MKAVEILIIIFCAAVVIGTITLKIINKKRGKGGSCDYCSGCNCDKCGKQRANIENKHK